MKRNTSCSGLRRIVICLCATAGVICAGSASADSVKAMCKNTDEICNCAVEKLKSDIGMDKYNLYAAIGSAYIANKTKGMNRGDAWDAAVKVEAKKRGSSFVQTLEQTNAIGKAHRKAIKTCSG